MDVMDGMDVVTKVVTDHVCRRGAPGWESGSLDLREIRSPRRVQQGPIFSARILIEAEVLDSLEFPTGRARTGRCPQKRAHPRNRPQRARQQAVHHRRRPVSRSAAVRAVRAPRAPDRTGRNAWHSASAHPHRRPTRRCPHRRRNPHRRRHHSPLTETTETNARSPSRCWANSVNVGWGVTPALSDPRGTREHAAPCRRAIATDQSEQRAAACRCIRDCPLTRRRDEAAVTRAAPRGS